MRREVPRPAPLPPEVTTPAAPEVPPIEPTPSAGPRFADLPLPTTIATAIARKGYTAPTGVQAAVLEGGHAGRDLLVSSQTGSGKTLAFGILIAEVLLAPPPAPVDSPSVAPAGPPAAAVAPSAPSEGTEVTAAGELAASGEPPVVSTVAPMVEPPAAPAGAPTVRRPAHGRARKGRVPRALVVAPTRELASQVCRELAWLLEDSRLAIGAFTGGTDVRGDLRQLYGGVDVAVGTPGRLCDLATRGALDLSGVQAVVLDEADEMLDLGFKDDIEKLLGATPTERRTLLFSATIPREIEALARTYTRNPLRIDARSNRGGGAHDDITYKAYLVRGVDRFAALVNVLVAAGDAKAIVFGRTREGVGALHQRLVDHGFRVVSMAGDRAQAERDRALEALREGRARILVATNVAARGLDLPDVELVVHADLPDSAEDLTHRSGRTGRAGRKGTSVVFAEATNRRKAERLFMNARLPLKWSTAPSQDEAQAAVVDGLVHELVAAAREPGRDAPALEAGEGSGGPHEVNDPALAVAGSGEGARAPHESSDPAFAVLVDRLRAALPERVLLPLLLRRELATRPRALLVEALALHGRDVGPVSPGRARPASLRGGQGAPAPVIFRINVGGADGAEPRLLLPLICRRGGVTRHAVGAIRINARNATFEIAAEEADAFARAASRSDPRDPDVRIERAPSR